VHENLWVAYRPIDQLISDLCECSVTCRTHFLDRSSQRYHSSTSLDFISLLILSMKARLFTEKFVYSLTMPAKFTNSSDPDNPKPSKRPCLPKFRSAHTPKSSTPEPQANKSWVTRVKMSDDGRHVTVKAKERFHPAPLPIPESQRAADDLAIDTVPDNSADAASVPAAPAEETVKSLKRKREKTTRVRLPFLLCLYRFMNTILFTVQTHPMAYSPRLNTRRTLAA